MIRKKSRPIKQDNPEANLPKYRRERCMGKVVLQFSSERISYYIKKCWTNGSSVFEGKTIITTHHFLNCIVYDQSHICENKTHKTIQMK